ncbi:hypothetical protein [Methylomicrobium lacus]|uniref:hypothetical protein n=1 Tax=Methylomicrobium lacus TaxID=136992 RepID=UPI001FDFE465|nr:hypothetical protein [Methylomicrobium lacus]
MQKSHEFIYYCPFSHESLRSSFLIVLGLLTAILVVMAILPSQLLGQMEISFQEVASTGKNPRSVPSFVDWMVFCEMGGRWLLGIVAAWLSIQFQRWLLR